MKKDIDVNDNQLLISCRNKEETEYVKKQIIKAFIDCRSK